jgi:hypothetical protein
MARICPYKPFRRLSSGVQAVGLAILQSLSAKLLYRGLLSFYLCSRIYYLIEKEGRKIMKMIIALLVLVAIMQQVAKRYSINSIGQFKEFNWPSK